MKTNGLALTALAALWIATAAPAFACNGPQRPLMTPAPALTQHVASMAKTGLFRPASHQAKTNDVPAPSIVGLWHSTYSYGGDVVDESFEIYHDDGTEMEVDQSAPVTDNVCSGAWEQTGTLTFKLNHPSFIFDPGGNLIGMAIIRDVVTIDRGGNKFSGTETVDVFDNFGRLLTHSEGLVSSTRITAN